MVVLEPNGSSSAKPLKSQDPNNPSGPSVPKPPPYGHLEGTYSAAGQPGYPNVRPYPGAEAYSSNHRREPPGMRFLKALCVAVLVWMLCGAFVRSWVWSIGWNRENHGGWDGSYPIPSGVSLRQCLKPAQWDNALSTPNLLNLERDSYAANQSAQDLQLLPPSAYPFVSKTSFELPISSNSLYLLSRGAYASGSVDILTSTAQKQSSAAVHVVVYYHHQELRDRVKLCRVSRRAGESGVGIFTPSYVDRHNPRDQLYFETVIMFPQSTQRRSPLRIKNLETDVVNTFHRVHAIAEHVVFDNISLAGSNTHISSSDLAANFASVQTSNGAILGSFNASKELKLVTSNGQVKVDVHLDNDLSSTPSKLYIETSNAPLEANIDLHASGSGVKGQYPQYKVDTKTSNNKLDVDFQNSPADSTLYYKGDTSNGPTNVQLHAAYQGSFKVSTSSSWVVPELHVRENVPDPSGKGRKREVQHTSLYKGELTGSVKWVDEKEDKKLEMGTVEVKTSNAKAVLVV